MKLADYVRIMGIDLRETDEVPSVDDLRIVENIGGDTLESLDEDTEIMDIPLNLSEACVFSFDKHVEAIVGAEATAIEEHKKYTRFNVSQENAKEYDRRYKERPGNRIRYSK